MLLKVLRSLTALLIFATLAAPSARAEGEAVVWLAEAFQRPLGRWIMGTEQGKLLSLYLGAAEGDVAALVRGLRDPALDGLARDLQSGFGNVRARVIAEAATDAELAEFARTGKLTPRAARIFQRIVAEELPLAWGSRGDLTFVKSAPNARAGYAAGRTAFFEAGVAAKSALPTRETVIAAVRKGQSLAGMKLGKLKLNDAALENGNFERADLSGADLSGADLSGAKFFKADLRGADLSGVRMDNATDFRHAIVNDSTKLPFDRWTAKGYGFDVR